ncbi:MAG: hypothetical protein A2Y76_01965 [Planctomycetes bacterium RBG_13_60_9]|nr:MAG: hypothetical protein A2Y76_01965 [Planctomycetes bacterium RBG_13_60_9]
MAMRLLRLAALLAGFTLAGGWSAAHLLAADTKKPRNDIWKDEPRESRPWWQRDLTEDVIEKVMKGIQTRDPAQAKQLSELRKKDRERFKAELREQGRPELEQMARERYEARRHERTAKFIEWLKANYPAEEQALAKLKDGDPQLYARNLDHLTNEYSYIFEAASSSPDLGAVLKEDYDLKMRANELCKQLRNEKSDAKRQALGIELQEVVARRYDLIVRKKEIAFDQLLKKLDELQKQVRDSKGEMDKWRDEKIKQENVKQRLQELTGNKVRFKWD